MCIYVYLFKKYNIYILLTNCDVHWLHYLLRWNQINHSSFQGTVLLELGFLLIIPTAQHISLKVSKKGGVTMQKKSQNHPWKKGPWDPGSPSENGTGT